MRQFYIWYDWEHISDGKNIFAFCADEAFVDYLKLRDADKTKRHHLKIYEFGSVGMPYTRERSYSWNKDTNSWEWVIEVRGYENSTTSNNAFQL